jgi:uncharacterized membrane protein YgcG
MSALFGIQVTTIIQVTNQTEKWVCFLLCVPVDSSSNSSRSSSNSSSSSGGGGSNFTSVPYITTDHLTPSFMHHVKYMCW